MDIYFKELVRYPAFMTRQISEIAMGQDGVQLHITSLKPIRPPNEPTAREKEFLKEFEAGIKEKEMFIKEGEKTLYFYMAPLIPQSCIKKVLKNKKPFGIPVIVMVSTNHKNYNRRYPNGKKTEKQYQEKPHS